MANPWRGRAPPDTPVTVTLPYRVALHVLTAVVNDAHRVWKRFSVADRERRLRDLAAASDALGDAVGAPEHRRYRYPTDEENKR